MNGRTVVKLSLRLYTRRTHFVVKMCTFSLRNTLSASLSLALTPILTFSESGLQEFPPKITLGSFPTERLVLLMKVGDGAKAKAAGAKRNATANFIIRRNSKK
jgi:hypothetical protein